MAKVKLGQKPATFKPFPVKFQMPDGEEGVITPTYVYRSRSDFGALLNKMFAEAGKEKPVLVEGEAAKPIDFEALFSETGTKNAEHLLSSLSAWDLDKELNLESLKELCDTLPAGAAALMSAYSLACNEGRLGN